MLHVLARDLGALLVITATAAGCAPAPTAPPPSQPPAPRAAPSHDASATPINGVSPAPAPAPVAFSVAIEIDERDLFAFAVGSVAVIVAGRFDGERTFVLDDAGLREDPRLRAGVEGPTDSPASFSLGSVWGDFPAMFASINLPGDRGGFWVDYVWSGDRWTKRPPKDQGQSGWSDAYSRAYYMGALLAAGPDGLHQRLDDGDRMTWKPVMGWQKANDRRPLPVLAPAAAAHKKDCSARLRRHYDFDATPDGGLVGVGVLCGEGAGSLAVERWAPGWRRSTVTVIPGGASHHAPFDGLVSSHKPEVFARGSTVVVAAFVDAPPGTPPSTRSSDIGAPRPLAPFVARLDGERVETMSPPGAVGPYRDIDVGADGSVALLDDAKLWVRAAGATSWTSIAPPSPAESLRRAPDGSHWLILDDGRVARLAPGAAAFEIRGFPPREAGTKLRASRIQWLAGGEALVEAGVWKGDDAVGAVVLREKREGVIPRSERVRPPTVAVGTTKPITAGCKEPLAVLFGMSRVAPDDYDFPATRKALKGKLRFRGTELFVGRDAGRRYLVARPPSVAMGRELVALIEKEVAGSKPQLVCGSPAEIIRPFRLDLGTGELVK